MKVIYVGITSTSLSQRKSCGWWKIPIPKDELIIVELETTTDVDRERFWIEYYLDKGCDLYNISRGETGLDNPEYKKLWYQENKERINKASVIYKENNKQRLKEYRSNYYSKLPHVIEKNRERSRLYKLKKKQEKLNQST